MFTSLLKAEEQSNKIDSESRTIFKNLRKEI